MTTEKLRPGMLVEYIARGGGPRGPFVLVQRLIEREKYFAPLKGEYWEFIHSCGQLCRYFFDVKKVVVVETELKDDSP